MIKLIATHLSGEWVLDPVHAEGAYSLDQLRGSKINLVPSVKEEMMKSQYYPKMMLVVNDNDIKTSSPKSSGLFFIKTQEYELQKVTIEKLESETSKTLDSEILALIKSDKRYSCPSTSDEGEDSWYVDPDVWEFLMASYLTGQHILLRGDTGSGKTELVRLIARRLGADLDIIDMSILDGRTTLCGSTKLLNGNTVIKPARFAQKIAEPSFILLDELSRADAMANNVLLPVLDSRRVLHMEELGDIENVQRNEKCVIWATANIGIEYTGTGNIDEAIANRFIQVHLSYAPVDKETELLCNRAKISRKDAKRLATMAELSRSNNQITHPVSTRQLLTIAAYVHIGFEVDVATRMCLSAIYSGRGDSSLDILLSNLSK